MLRVRLVVGKVPRGGVGQVSSVDLGAPVAGGTLSCLFGVGVAAVPAGGGVGATGVTGLAVAGSAGRRGVGKVQRVDASVVPPGTVVAAAAAAGGTKVRR